jgi:nitrate reductase delta subunit
VEHLEELYDLLAGLATYPEEEYAARLQRARELVAADISEAAHWLERFAELIDPLSATELEELFTRTFDLNPVCCLELGWHLFGENYERGEFMVAMRGQLRRFGLQESAELPDHLSHVLRVLGRLPVTEADLLLRRSVLPALEKMLAGLSASGNPFMYLLEAIRGVLLSPCAVVLRGLTPPAPAACCSVPVPLLSGG